jgi:AmmeMemoRadiSam system protein B
MVDARKPVAAGVFYPAERETLARTVRALLQGATVPSPGAHRIGRPRAIVVPHGMMGPSGLVAAAGWARVAPYAALLGRVVLLGPAHHTQFAGMAAPFADSFSTPLGAVDVDRVAIETARRFPQLVVSDEPHEQEPSLEVQVPFVQTLLPHATIVPLLVGAIPDEDAADVVDSLWDEETLLVVSTDLSHYYDATEAQRVDEATAYAIETLDARLIGEQEACGHSALRALVTAARARSLQAARLDLRHTGEASGDVSEVVGFGAFMLG